MADEVVRPLETGETDDEALALVRRDLLSSEKFKREYWPSDKVVLRRRAYEGDPEAFDFPYDSEWGARLVPNWMLRQINHKVGKLAKSPTRLNTRHRDGKDDDDTRLLMAAAQHRLERKGREAGWPDGRRRMLLDAAKTAFGVRCIGLVYDRNRYYLKNWRVRAEEFHMDGTAEFFDDAEWMSWRRYVSSSKLGDSLARNPGVRPAGAGSSLVPDSRPSDISLSDDRILSQGRGLGGRGSATMGTDPILVTDYWRKDQSQNYYFPCPNCDRYAGVSMIRTAPDKLTPQYKCGACGKDVKKTPKRDTLRRMARYPFGRHIRILGGSSIDYRGPNRLKLQDVFPMVGMAWYDGETWNGISEVQQLAAPVILNMVAQNMLADNAFANVHGKVVIPKEGIEGGWNNDPNIPLEVSGECWQQGGPKPLNMGDFSASGRILLERSTTDLFLLAANSPESQGQAPDTLRSGVGLRSVIAASEVGLYLTQLSLLSADARFYRIARDLLGMMDSPAQIPMVAPDGTPGSYDYDRTVMSSMVDVEVLTDRDVDQEREELFSRASEMRQMQVAAADDDMLLELSGIPEDILYRARQRAQVLQAQQAAMQQAGALPPELGAMPAKPQPTPGGQPNGNGHSTMPPAIAARMGANAPRPTRPPSRSRGGQTPSTPFGGA